MPKKLKIKEKIPINEFNNYYTLLKNINPMDGASSKVKGELLR